MGAQRTERSPDVGAIPALGQTRLNADVGRDDTEWIVRGASAVAERVR
jgi:hypothetical protein